MPLSTDPAFNDTAMPLLIDNLSIFLENILKNGKNFLNPQYRLNIGGDEFEHPIYLF